MTAQQNSGELDSPAYSEAQSSPDAQSCNRSGTKLKSNTARTFAITPPLCTQCSSDIPAHIHQHQLRNESYTQLGSDQPTSRALKRRSWWILGSSVLLLLILGGGLFYTLNFSQPPQDLIVGVWTIQRTGGVESRQVEFTGDGQYLVNGIKMGIYKIVDSDRIELTTQGGTITQGQISFTSDDSFIIVLESRVLDFQRVK